MADTPRDAVASRQVAGEIAGRADSLSGRLLEVTTPLYPSDAHGKPEAIGSAVLLAIGPFRFLISAAHVLNERSVHTLYFPTQSELVPLSGDFTRILSTTARTDEDDHVDLGVVRLSGEPWVSLDDKYFTQWLELDHAGHFLMDYAFALLGYPLTKQRNPVEGEFLVARAYRLIALECGQRVYDQERFDPNVHLLVGFDKRKTWSVDGQEAAPHLYGVSGGGLWSFRKHSVLEATRPPWLAAIAVEWRARGQYKYVLATRISVVLDALVQRYADVRSTTLELARMRSN